MADPHPGRHLQSFLALAGPHWAAVMVATAPAGVKLNAALGTFSAASPYSMERGRYEGLLYKLADESLDPSRRARRSTCLPDRTDRGSGGGPRGRAGGRADCVARDLIAGESRKTLRPDGNPPAAVVSPLQL